MPKSRQDTLFELGLDLFEERSSNLAYSRDESLLYAFAGMLAEATKKPTKSTGNRPTYQDKQAGQALYDRLKKEAPGVVAYTPVQERTFGQLGKNLREASITEAQLDIFVEWMKTNPFAWRDKAPAWGELVKKIVDWVASALDWRDKSKGLDRIERESVLDKIRKQQGGL